MGVLGTLIVRLTEREKRVSFLVVLVRHHTVRRHRPPPSDAEQLVGQSDLHVRRAALLFLVVPYTGSRKSTHTTPPPYTHARRLRWARGAPVHRRRVR